MVCQLYKNSIKPNKITLYYQLINLMLSSKTDCTLYYGAYITPIQFQKLITYICQSKILSDDIEEHIKYMDGTYDKFQCDETEEEIANYNKEYQNYTKTIDWLNKTIFIHTFTICDIINQLKVSDKPEFIPESVFSYPYITG